MTVDMWLIALYIASCIAFAVLMYFVIQIEAREDPALELGLSLSSGRALVAVLIALIATVWPVAVVVGMLLPNHNK